MSSRKSQTTLRPPATFQKIMERALAGDADSVSLEPVPEGLECAGSLATLDSVRWSAITRRIGLRGSLYVRLVWNDVIGARWRWRWLERVERFPWRAMSTLGSGRIGFGWSLLRNVAAHNPPLEPTATLSDQ